MTEIKLYRSALKGVGQVLIGFLFLSPTLFGIIYPSDTILMKVVCWSLLFIFVLVICVGLKNILDRRPQIIMNQSGFFARMACSDFVNWVYIKNANYTDAKYGNQVPRKYITLTVNKAALPYLKNRTLIKSIAEYSDFVEVKISLDFLEKIDQQNFINFIMSMAMADADEKENLLFSTEL